MNTQKKAANFARYLHKFEQDEDATQLLARNPEDTEEMDSLGKVALRLRAAHPDKARLNQLESQSRERFLVEAQHKLANPVSQSALSIRNTQWQRLTLLPRGVIILLLVLFCLTSVGGGMVYASNSSLPGDPLYKVKLAQEDARRFFAFSVEKQIILQEKLTQQRLAEVTAVLEKEREVNVYFEGILNELQPDRWVVDYLVVHIPAHITIDGNPAVGSYIQMWAQAASQQHLVATAIKVQDGVVTGSVSAVGKNTWTVNGITMVTNPLVPTNLSVHVGDVVSIHTRSLPNGKRYAMHLEVDDQEKPETHRVDIRGVIEDRSDTQWRVGGLNILLTPQTQLNGSFDIGDEVKVQVIRLLDGRLYAIQIVSFSHLDEIPAPDNAEEGIEQPKDTENAEHPEIEPNEPEQDILESGESEGAHDFETEETTPEDDGKVESGDEHPTDMEDSTDTDTPEDEHDNNSSESDESHDDESEKSEASEDDDHEDDTDKDESDDTEEIQDSH